MTCLSRKPRPVGIGKNDVDIGGSELYRHLLAVKTIYIIYQCGLVKIILLLTVVRETSYLVWSYQHFKLPPLCYSILLANVLYSFV